jgi:hypothetical protein
MQPHGKRSPVVVVFYSSLFRKEISMSTTYEFRETEPQVKLTNLLEEVLKAFELAHLNPMKVMWVGSRAGHKQATWEEFCKVATLINYNNSYNQSGGTIQFDLMIRFPNGELRRTMDWNEGWLPDAWEWIEYSPGDIIFPLKGQDLINYILRPVIMQEGPLAGVVPVKRLPKVAGVSVPRRGPLQGQGRR